MAVDKTPVLKRCRSLDLDPTFLGYDKKDLRLLDVGKLDTLQEAEQFLNNKS